MERDDYDEIALFLLEVDEKNNDKERKKSNLCNKWAASLRHNFALLQSTNFLLAKNVLLRNRTKLLLLLLVIMLVGQRANWRESSPNSFVAS